MSIRLLFAIDYFHDTGGTEKHLSYLVVKLSQSFDVTVVAFDLGENPLIDAMREAGAKVLDLPVGRIYTPKALAQAFRLWRLIKQRRFDIVQTYHQKADTYGAIVARLAGVRHIVPSKRDTGDIRSQAYVHVSRLIRPWFEKVVVVADGVAEAIASSEGIDRSRIVRIYNGVDTDAFHPPSEVERGSARSRLGFRSEDFVVGMVANFRPEKSHGDLFEAARLARVRVPGLKLLLVGDGPMFDHYLSLYGPVTQGVESLFAGAVRDVKPYLHAMDVACLIPGSNEGFSNSVLEKMASGLALVVTDVGGNAEAVSHGLNGSVIVPGDPSALADALVSLHGNPELRREMGRQSRRLAEDRFSLDRMWKSHAELYCSLLGTPGPRRCDSRSETGAVV